MEIHYDDYIFSHAGAIIGTFDMSYELTSTILNGVGACCVTGVQCQVHIWMSTLKWCSLVLFRVVPVVHITLWNVLNVAESKVKVTAACILSNWNMFAYTITFLTLRTF